MDLGSIHTWLMVATFLLGYLFITIEHITKINKATVALMMAIICWIVQFADNQWVLDMNMGFFNHHLADISGVLFFILGALAVVEIMSQHRGFDIIADLIRVQSKKKLFWVVTFLAFFLSSLLDNLTTTVVMVTLLRKLIDKGSDRLILGGAVVIAANAGGAWSPIGDVTTTMLWIGGQVSSLGVVKSLFFPSLVCAIVSGWFLSRNLEGDFDVKRLHFEEKKVEPFGEIVFFLGLALVIFIPIFKVLTGLPPFMGVLFALSVLWFVTDLAHSRSHDREHLRVPHVLGKIDISIVFFFMGILLCVDALHAGGVLQGLTGWIDQKVGNLAAISLLIGLASAVVDNVPLVAAAMGMYDLATYPIDSSLWQMIAYCSGTGGSVLIIGSAAGVVFMGMEKVDFFWYARKIGLPALAGYFAGFCVYQLQW